LRQRLRPVRDGAASPPKSAGFPVPKEGQRSAPRGVPVAILRRSAAPRLRGAPGTMPRWNRATRTPRSARDPVPGGTKSTLIRRTLCLDAGGPSARCLIRSAGCPVPGGRESCPFGRGDGCARKRFQCDDAPICRSRPPRRRTHDRPGAEAPVHIMCNHPVYASAEAPTPLWAIVHPAEQALLMRVAPESSSQQPEDRYPGPVTRGRENSDALRLHSPR
jgi:hypothetical protein